MRTSSHESRFEGVPVVVLGGVLEGKRALTPVADAISKKNPSDVDVFTMTRADREPGRLIKALQQPGVLAVTHSAGIEPVHDLRRSIDPENIGGIEAHAPPFPRSVPGLAVRTIYKVAREGIPGIGIRSWQDAGRVGGLVLSAGGEFFAHPIGNFGQTRIISRFDTSVASIEATEAGVDFAVVHPDRDEFFQPTPTQKEAMASHGVSFYTIPKAVHDELLIRPGRALDLGQ